MGDEDTPPQNHNPGPNNIPPLSSPTSPPNLPLKPPILRTIHVPEKIDLFEGKRRPNDISFTEGPGLFDWLRTVDNYFNNTEIKEDKEKIARLSGYCDPYQGDASKEISQLAQ